MILNFTSIFIFLFVFKSILSRKVNPRPSTLSEIHHLELEFSALTVKEDTWEVCNIACREMYGNSSHLALIKTPGRLSELEAHLHRFEFIWDHLIWFGGLWNVPQNEFFWMDKTSFQGWEPWDEGHSHDWKNLTTRVAIIYRNDTGILFQTRDRAEPVDYFMCEVPPK